MTDSYRTPTITFEMKCEEDNWRDVINKYEFYLNLNPYNFDLKWLFINTINYDEVYEYAFKQLIEPGIIDRCINVPVFASRALDFFGLFPEDLGEAYLYSISEFVSLYLCETEFLLHCTNQEVLPMPIKWIGPAIDILDFDEQIKIVCPNWVDNYGLPYEPASASFMWDVNFCKYCYLIRSEDFRSYDVFHEAKEGTFEKRIDSWMKNNQFLRVVYQSQRNKYSSWFEETKLKKYA